MAIPKTILVVGATGTQGSATVKALLASPQLPADARILTLTRNTSSPKAKALAVLDSRVLLHTGDPTAPGAIFNTAPSHIDAVFCVTVHGPPGAEETQAEGLFDASVAHNVSHFVFTSADRGGETVSDRNPTPVPHIATKYRIETYIREKAQGTNTAWTFLRPVTFFDNLTNDFNGKGFSSMWQGVGQKPVQMVATSDIGFFAANSLLAPDEWSGKSIGIAGDELNFDQAKKVFKDALGTEMPHTFGVVGTLVKTVLGDIGSMFKWFEKDGFNVDIQKARSIHPGLMNFSTWLEKESQFEKVEKLEKTPSNKLEKATSGKCECGRRFCSKCKS
jgi:uncharacterized protein YbjT (DUF2867 family)